MIDNPIDMLCQHIDNFKLIVDGGEFQKLPADGLDNLKNLLTRYYPADLVLDTYVFPVTDGVHILFEWADYQDYPSLEVDLFTSIGEWHSLADDNHTSFDLTDPIVWAQLIHQLRGLNNGNV
jgi:hypothetical protein